MSEPRKIARALLAWAVPAAVGISALVLPWFGFTEPLVNQFFRQWMAGVPGPGDWSVIDDVFLRASPDGDVAVRFVNVSEAGPLNEEAVHQIIHRGTYALFPRRLRMVEDGTVVMGAPAVLESRFNPTVQWLQDRNVRTVIIYRNNNEKMDIVLARVPPQDGSAATTSAAAPTPNGTTGVAWGIVYVVIVLVIGCAITSAVVGRDTNRSISELAGLVLALGAGGTATVLFWISLLGVRPGRGVIMLLGLAALVSLIVQHFRHRLPRLEMPSSLPTTWPQRLLTGAPLILLAGALVVATILSLGLPILNWDSFNIWASKAKVLHSTALTPRPDFFTDVTVSFTHLDYPLLLPMLLAGAYGAMEQVQEKPAKIVLPMLLAAQMLLCYTGARLWLRRLPALMVTTLLICAPATLRYCSLCSAELPLTVFWLGSIVYLIRWVVRNQRSDLILSALLIIFTANTKNEGLALALIATLALFGYAAATRQQRRAWIDLSIFLAILVVGIGVWLSWRSELPHTDENYPARVTSTILLENIGRLGSILPAMLKSMASPWIWGGLWLVIPLVATVGYRAFSGWPARLLWMLLVLHLGSYVFIYIITSWDLNLLMRDSLNRLLLHVSPTVALLISVHWGTIQRTEPTP